MAGSSGTATGHTTDGVPAAGAVTRTPPGLGEVVGSFHEIFGAIAADAELDLVLHLVARHITRLLSIDRCSVYLRDTRSGLFRGQVGETAQDSDPHIKRLTCGGAADGFTREIVATRRPVLIRNAQHDPRPVRATMRAWNVRDILGVPMVNGGEVIGLLFLDDSTAARPFSQDEQDLAASFADLAGMGISQSIRATELLEQRATLERRTETARRSTVIDERLTSLALEAADLQEIARAISQLTEKACAIHGSRLQRKGFAAGVAQDAPAVRILEPEQRRIPEVAAALRDLRPRRPTIVGPFPRAGLAHRAMVTRVTAGAEDLGYVVLAETRGRFTELDVAASRRSAMIVAFELVAQRRAAEADQLAREILARDLLRGTEDAESLRRRAGMLDVDLDHPAVVVLLRAHEADGAPVTVDELRRAEDAVPELAPLGTTAMGDGVVAVLLPLTTDVDRRAAYGRAVDAAAALRTAVAAPDRRVFAAVSAVCREPDAYRGAFVDAGNVLRRVRRGGPAGPDGPWLASAERLGVGRLFLAPDQRADVLRFAVDTLGPLLGDDERSRTLLATLRAYFAAAGNTKDAADALGVHANTVRYRLANVHELTGMDVALNAEDQLTAHLAISALDDDAGRTVDAPGTVGEEPS